MERIARWLGYGTAFTAIGLLLWLFAGLRSELSTPSHWIRVRFPETGTLRVEDPVTRQGVVVGRVFAVKADKLGALVTLELFEKNPLLADARFVNFNHSLMGDRMVVLVPGSSSILMNESEVQEGMFANGVAETIHSVDRLMNMVLNYNQIATRMKGPRDSTGSWSGLVPDKIYPIFDEIHRLSAALEQAKIAIEPRLASVAASTEQLNELATNVHLQAHTWVNFTQLTIDQLDSLSHTGETVIATLDSLLQMTAGPNAAMRPLFFERTLYERTLQLSEVLQSALLILQNDGLDIIHGRNLHFFRAHSKGVE